MRLTLCRYLLKGVIGFRRGNDIWFLCFLILSIFSLSQLGHSVEKLIPTKEDGSRRWHDKKEIKRMDEYKVCLYVYERESWEKLNLRLHTYIKIIGLILFFSIFFFYKPNIYLFLNFRACDNIHSFVVFGGQQKRKNGTPFRNIYHFFIWFLIEFCVVFKVDPKM